MARQWFRPQQFVGARCAHTQWIRRLVLVQQHYSRAPFMRVEALRVDCDGGDQQFGGKGGLCLGMLDLGMGMGMEWTDCICL
jgi:hypothetical protein